VRDGTVYKLRSRTLPLGILRDSAPQLLRFRMHPGDVVVMVSDGATHGNDECPWLIDLLSSPMPDSMDNLRSDIIRRAIASGSPDDLSAIAVRVEEASGHQSTP
jgi:serine phosphatase RsbU (regulator of sigma subunit)